MVDGVTHKPIRSSDVAALLAYTRKSRGRSLADVSKHLRVPMSTLQNIESGNIDDHLEVIYALICLYDVSTHTIFKGYFAQSHLCEIEADDVVGEVTDCIAFQKRLCGKSFHLTVVPKARGKIGGQSTKLAGGAPTSIRIKPTSLSVLEFRAKHLIDKHQMYRLPINVYQVAKNLGINVVFESFPNNLYMKLKAFCYKENNFGLIGINKKHKAQLQRYSMAHELHHFLYDFESDSFACGPDNQSEAAEIDAERFAAELLMPKQMIEKLTSNPLNISYLTIDLVAQHFGVSYEAAAIRLARFGLIEDPKEACTHSHRKKDKKKTDFLLNNKEKFLRAVFGLETGIVQLQGYREEIEYHTLCGAPITSKGHSVCWQCGLEIDAPQHKDFHLKNPYRQQPSNLQPGKIISFNKTDEHDSNQLSLNLKVD